MAIVKMGSICHSIKGRVGGSVFRNNKYGVTLYSNNWSKGKHTWRSKQQRAQFAAVTSTWRSLTQQEQRTWNNLDAQSFPNANTSSGELYLWKHHYSALFSNLNSILAKSQRPKKIKPPRPDYEVQFKKSFVVSWYGTADYIEWYSDNLLGTCFVTMWLGPFFPVWRGLGSVNYLQVYSDLPAWIGSGVDFYYVFQGYYTSTFGNLPTDPGYIPFAGSFDSYSGAVLIAQAPFTQYVIPVNGAPPYSS